MAVRGIRAAIARLRGRLAVSEDEFELRLNEPNHPNHITVRYLWRLFKSLPENVPLHRVMCVSTVVAYVGALAEMGSDNAFAIYVTAVIIVYEALCALTSLARLNNFMIRTYEKNLDDIRFERNFLFSFVVDLTSFTHHFADELPQDTAFEIHIFCLLMRLHRPLGYLIGQMTHYMDGSQTGLLIKYYFYSVIARLLLIVIFVIVDEFMQDILDLDCHKNHMEPLHYYGIYVNWDYLMMVKIYKPKTIYELLLSLFFVTTGFMLRMLCVAALSQAFSVHSLAAERFAARLRLMRVDMKYTKVPKALYRKVETYYHMYWAHQRAVSRPQQLTLFPPSFAAVVAAELYFEAQQKSPLLRELSFQFLVEVAQVMRTARFLTGDTIVARGARRHTIYYVTYGDVLLLSAEDDQTAMLRLCRGSVLNPLGVCAALANTRSHIEVRAASYCVVHTLRAVDFWRVAVRCGKASGQVRKVFSTFKDIIDKIKRYHRKRVKQVAKHKSSILQLKHNLLALKKVRAADGSPLVGREDFMLEVAGAYMIRNHEDLTLTEETDETCLRPTFPFIWTPHSSLLQFWDCAVAALIVLVCFTHPYNIVYCKERSMKFMVFDYAVSGVFLMDMFIFLSTAVNVEEGVPLTFAATASRRAAEPWLAVDAAATLPVFEFIGDGAYAGINKVLRLHKVFKVAARLEEQSSAEPGPMRVVLCFLCVLLAAFYLGAVQQTFMCRVHGRCVVTNHTSDLDSYWLPGPLDEDTVMDRIYYSMYWALNILGFLMVKTQLFMPEDWRNIVYITLVLEFAMCFHFLVYSLYAALTIAHQSMSFIYHVTVSWLLHRNTYSASLEKIKRLLDHNRIPPVVRRRLLRYLQLCWYTDKAYSMNNNKTSFYFDLPAHVYKELVTKQHSKFLLTLPFVKAMSREMLRVVSAGTVIFYTSPQEIVFRTGDITSECYIIKEGYCEQVDPDTERIKILKPMDHFGVLEAIFNIPSYYSVRALTNVCLMSIDRKYLKNFLMRPNIRSIIDKVKETPEFPRLMKRRDQFMLYKELAKPPNRQKFVLPRKFESDAAFQLPFNMLGFFSLVRYMCPRWTLRPDGVYLERYEVFRGVCVLFNAFFYPIYFALSLERPFVHKLHYISTALTYFDIVQRLLTGYYNEKGVLVSHPASTALHYIRHAFLVDILAALPFEALEMAEGRGLNVLLDKVIDDYDTSISPPEVRHILYCNRLLQLYRIHSAMETVRYYVSRAELMICINALVVMAVLSGVFSMLIVFSSCDLTFDSGQWKLYVSLDPVSNMSWEVIYQQRVIYNVSSSILNMQLTCYFWTFTEMLFSGFFHFYVDYEFEVTILVVAQLLGMIVKIYFTVMVIAHCSHANRELSAHREHFEDLVRFLQYERVDPTIISMLTHYYTFNWDKMGGLDYRAVLTLIDQTTLRSEAILFLYGATFDKCPVLQGGWTSLMRALGQRIDGRFYPAGWVIVQCDDVLRSLFLVDSGTIEVYDPNESEEIIDILTVGSMFGNLATTGYQRFPYQLVAADDVHLLRVSAADAHEVLAQFPEHGARMRTATKQNENYMIGRISASSSKVHSSRLLSKDKEQTMAGPRFLKTFTIENHLYATYVAVSGLICVYGDLYNAAFWLNSTAMLTTLYLGDLLFFVTVIIHIVRPLVIEDGKARKQLREERSRYIKSAFKYEILSCLPLELFSWAISQHTWGWFAILRLNRLLRAITVMKTLGFHRERLGSNMVAVIALWMFVTMSIVVHMFACAFGAMGLYGSMVNGKSWITVVGISGREEKRLKCGTVYTCSLIYSIRAFASCSHANLVPTTQYEIVLVMAFQLLSWMLTMLYIGQFCRIVKSMTSRSFDYYYIVKELQTFLHNNRVSPNLQKMLSRYSLHLWRKTHGHQLPHFVVNAPCSIRKLILSSAYQQHLFQHPVFKDCELALIQHVCEQIIPYKYCEDMFIVRKTEITNCMYFVRKGRVRALAEDDRTRGEVYGVGQYFGTEQGLIRDLPFKNTYRAVNNCTVLTLKFDKWEYLLSLFPYSRDIIYGKVPEMHISRPISKPKPPPPPPPSMQQPISKTSSTDVISTKTVEKSRESFKFTTPDQDEEEEEFAPTGRRKTIFRKIIDTFGTVAATNELGEPGGPHRRRTFLQIISQAFQGKEDADTVSPYPTQRRKTLFQRAFGKDDNHELDSRSPQMGRRKTFFGKVKNIGDDEARLRFADRDTLLIQEELATLDSYVDEDFDFEEIGPGVEDDDYQEDFIIKEHKKGKSKKLPVRESVDKSNFPFPFRDKKKRYQSKKPSQDNLKEPEKQNDVIEDKGIAEVEHEEIKMSGEDDIKKDNFDKAEIKNEEIVLDKEVDIEKDEIQSEQLEEKYEEEDKIIYNEEKPEGVRDDTKINEVEKDDEKANSKKDEIYADELAVQDVVKDEDQLSKLDVVKDEDQKAELDVVKDKDEIAELDLVKYEIERKEIGKDEDIRDEVGQSMMDHREVDEIGKAKEDAVGAEKAKLEEKYMYQVEEAVTSKMQSSELNIEPIEDKKDDTERVAVEQIAITIIYEVVDEVVKSEIHSRAVNVEPIEDKKDDVDLVVFAIIDEVVDEAVIFKTQTSEVNVEAAEDEQDDIDKIDVDQIVSSIIDEVVDDVLKSEKQASKASAEPTDDKERIFFNQIAISIIEAVVDDIVKSEIPSDKLDVESMEDKEGDVEQTNKVIDEVVKHKKRKSEVKDESIEDEKDENEKFEQTSSRRKSLFQRMTQKITGRIESDDVLDADPLTNNLLDSFKIVEIDQDLLQKDREEIDRAHSELHRPSTTPKSHILTTDNEDEDDDEVGDMDSSDHEFDIEEYLKGNKKDAQARRERRMTRVQFGQDDDEVDDDDEDDDDYDYK